MIERAMPTPGPTAPRKSGRSRGPSQKFFGHSHFQRSMKANRRLKEVPPCNSRCDLRTQLSLITLARRHTFTFKPTRGCNLYLSVQHKAALKDMGALVDKLTARVKKMVDEALD